MCAIWVQIFSLCSNRLIDLKLSKTFIDVVWWNNHVYATRQSSISSKLTIITSAKEGMFYPAFVCLSVCLLAGWMKKRS